MGREDLDQIVKHRVARGDRLRAAASAISVAMTFELIASAAMPAGSSNATATTMARFRRRRRLSGGLQIRRQMRFNYMPRAIVLADGKD